MITVIAYKTYKKYQTGMTDVNDLRNWLKETTGEVWPIVLIYHLLVEAKRELSISS